MANVDPVAPPGLTMREVAAAAADRNVTLEVATRQERAQLLDIAKLIFPDSATWEKEKENVKHYSETPRQSGMRGLVCLVAKSNNGDVVGYIFYQPERRRKTEVYIKEMGVSPKIGSKGIGVVLLGYVVAEAQQNNRSAIKLYTTMDKDSKQGYYAKWGFTPVPDDKYDDEGYRTDYETPDKKSLLMKGDVNAVGLAISGWLNK
jgi:N-acetylglutamate synthase-like GNAT family acetyltransferase